MMAKGSRYATHLLQPKEEWDEEWKTLLISLDWLKTKGVISAAVAEDAIFILNNNPAARLERAMVRFNAFIATAQDFQQAFSNLKNCEAMMEAEVRTITNVLQVQERHLRAEAKGTLVEEAVKSLTKSGEEEGEERNPFEEAQDDMEDYYEGEEEEEKEE
jgi:hypothetical protein